MWSAWTSVVRQQGDSEVFACVGILLRLVLRCVVQNKGTGTTEAAPGGTTQVARTCDCHDYSGRVTKGRVSFGSQLYVDPR